MKIIMTNLNLIHPLGSEVWTWTVARELLRRKHSVTVFTIRQGAWSVYMHRRGVGIIPRINPKERYDLLISGHSGELERMGHHISRINARRHIFISHGIGKLERPLNWKGPTLKKVAISSETFAFRQRTGIKMDAVIPNPVDPQWFEVPEAKNLTSALWGNHRHNCPKVLMKALKSARINLIGPFRKLPPERIIREIAGCGIVFGTGRWIYENMPSKVCLIVDSSRNLGLVDENNFHQLQDYNMTCRALKVEQRNNYGMINSWGDNIEKILDMDYKALIQRTRNIALTNLHSRIIVDKLLDL